MSTGLIGFQPGLAVLAASMLAVAAPAHAGPTLVFALDQISSSAIGSGSLGTVTLTQDGDHEVDVDVILVAGYSFINTGGPHTPFAFNLDVVGVTVTVDPSTGRMFVPNAAGGSATPYGTFSYAIDYTGRNGGGHGNAGPLRFSVAHGSGIDTMDFIDNSLGYFFAADLSSATGQTGSVASSTLRPPITDAPPGIGLSTSLPEPATLALLGLGLVGLGLSRRKQ